VKSLFYAIRTAAESVHGDFDAYAFFAQVATMATVPRDNATPDSA